MSDSEKQSVEGFPLVDHSVTHTSFRHDQNNIYINDVPISKAEFTQAFGGTFEVSPREVTKQVVEYGNPVPAGLAAFSASAISLGLMLMHARSVHVVNVMIGAFLTTSGLVDIIVGILCFILGNTWASCTFLMFGGFWSSYSFLLMNVGNVSESYSSDNEYGQAVALFFVPWAIFSFGLWICTLKSTIALSSLMFLIWLFLLLITISLFINSTNLLKAAGFFTLLAGCVGYYNVLAGLVDKNNSYFGITPVSMPIYGSNDSAETV